MGGDLETEGSVTFVPINDGRSTEVHVIVRLALPAERAGLAIAHDPARHLQNNLLRFKQIMESAAAPIISPQATAPTGSPSPPPGA